MKKNSSLIVALLVVLFPVFNSSGEEADVQEIRNKYNLIEGYQLDPVAVKFDLEDDPLSGTITYFDYNGQIVKIALDSGAEHGGSSELFYYWEGKLLFVLKSDSMWRFSGNKLPDGQSETVDSLKEYRFYFQNDNCIRSLVRGTEATSEKLLKEKISKTTNQPLSDPEMVTRVKQRAQAVYLLKGTFGL